MRSLIRSNAHTQISGLIYSKIAELLFIGLLLVFIYPFASLISGVDPTVPIEGQSQNKIVYHLQVAFPFFCLAMALLYRGSGICLLAITMIYPIFASHQPHGLLILTTQLDDALGDARAGLWRGGYSGIKISWAPRRLPAFLSCFSGVS